MSLGGSTTWNCVAAAFLATAAAATFQPWIFGDQIEEFWG